MPNSKAMVETVRWRGGKVELVDQRLLPHKLKYISCRTAGEMFEAIRSMKVRGAPAIGIAGAFGVYLGVKNIRVKNFTGFLAEVKKTVKYLAGSRPTANDLFWAMEKIESVIMAERGKSPNELKKLVLSLAIKMLADDIKKCRAIGYHGKKLIRTGSSILTHCNAGGLATGGFGTALGVIYASGKKIKRVFADETRPLLQGARLTMWELDRNSVPCTLICDNMAGDLMSRGEIDAVIVGADRIAANGDAANKIGTYSLAVLASYHKVPFYVAAPFSTFDLSLETGGKIPIERRSGSEVKEVMGKLITLKGASVLNPAFDVTPAGLITAIITENGVIRKPDRKKIRRMAGINGEDRGGKAENNMRGDVRT